MAKKLLLCKVMVCVARKFAKKLLLCKVMVCVACKFDGSTLQRNFFFLKAHKFCHQAVKERKTECVCHYNDKQYTSLYGIFFVVYENL